MTYTRIKLERTLCSCVSSMVLSFRWAVRLLTPLSAHTRLFAVLGVGAARTRLPLHRADACWHRKASFEDGSTDPSKIFYTKGEQCRDRFKVMSLTSSSNRRAMYLFPNPSVGSGYWKIVRYSTSNFPKWKLRSLTISTKVRASHSQRPFAVHHRRYRACD